MIKNFFSNKLITGLMKISFSPRSDLDYGKFKYFNDLLTSSNNWLREMEEQSNQTSFEIDYYVNTMEKLKISFFLSFFLIPSCIIDKTRVDVSFILLSISLRK